MSYNIPDLMQQVQELYPKIVAKGGTDLLATTRKKILDAREWQPCQSYINANFDRVLTELNVMYVPKRTSPGPCFLFPLLGIDGTYQRAQTKPLEGSELAEVGKYVWIGERIPGPSWLGNNVDTLKRVMELRAVVLVEGPFDLLACRLLAPDLPIMCPLTKRIGGRHEAYLRILGVETAMLMFDNERPKDSEHSDGEGNIAMNYLSRDIKTMKIEQLRCPTDDPAACLKSPRRAHELQRLLLGLFQSDENPVLQDV